MLEQGPLSGQRLGDRYRLGALLGQGGFGAVYQAQHLFLNRPQAIKILLEQHFTNAKFSERFLREAQVLAKLDHLHIVHVDDFGIDGRRAYLVMPFISGGTLQDLLTVQRGPLALDATRRYLAQICAALDYAHVRNVAHLDLKPLNLLIHEDGRLLLSDFGLAHLMEQGAVEGGTSLSFGTPSYMAPEHFDGQPEQRSDVYALGVILYQMLSGRLPFEGSTPRAIMMKLLTTLPPPLSASRPDLPPGVDVVLGKALAKDKEQRYQTAGHLLADFQAVIGGHQMPFQSSGLSFANAPTLAAQPRQESTPGLFSAATARAANPPGVALPPTARIAHAPPAPVLASVPQRTSRTAKKRLTAAIVVLAVQLVSIVLLMTPFINSTGRIAVLAVIGGIGFYGWLIFLVLGHGVKNVIRRNGTVKGVGLASVVMLLSWLMLLIGAAIITLSLEGIIGGL